MAGFAVVTPATTYLDFRVIPSQHAIALRGISCGGQGRVGMLSDCLMSVSGLYSLRETDGPSYFTINHPAHRKERTWRRITP